MFSLGGPHEQSTTDFKAIGLGHILEQDASLVALLDDLKPGWEAERTDVASPWKRSRCVEEQD